MVEISRIEAFRRKRTVPNPADDIQRVNEMLLLASDGAAGSELLRSLGAAGAVAERVSTANAGAVSTAVRCGIPLVEFSKVVEECVAIEPRLWRLSAEARMTPEPQRLALFALTFAHDLSLRNITMTKRYFGMSRMGAERLSELAVAHLETLSLRGASLLRLRAGDDPEWWDRLLIGDRCVGPRALRIARTAAQQRLASA